MACTRANGNLLLATAAFAISFAVWGLIAALAPIFKANYHLTATQTSLIVAIPVLLGAVGRLPAGILTDRLGGRVVFSLLLAFAAVPCLALAINHSHAALLFWGLWIGLAGSCFSVGVGFVSPWFPAARQGLALGIYGVGNIGQSVAVFAAPVIALTIGISPTFALFGLASLIWAVVFASLARDAPKRAPPSSVGESLGLLRRASAAWILSALYFLTFGGFVALGISLPILLRETFDLTPADAGFRTAGFVVLATLARPLGGWVADRVGGPRLLRAVFLGLAISAWVLLLGVALAEGDWADEHDAGGLAVGAWTLPPIIVFRVGALASATLLGLGNGAVFKLVPLYFPRQTSTATGLVGAAGGLGGFFPALTLGLLRDLTDSYATGFVLLSLYALGCVLLLRRLPRSDEPAPPAREAEPIRAK